MLVRSGSGEFLVRGLAGALVVIVGSGAGETVVGRLSVTVFVVRRSAGATLLVVVVGSGTGSK